MFCERTGHHFSTELLNVVRSSVGRILTKEPRNAIGLKIEDKIESASNSALALYLQTLGSSFLESDKNKLKESAETIAGNIAKKIEEKYCVRGLIFGRVQSGKTAHMCAVIAALRKTLRANHRELTVILLAGSMTNLCKQTEERMKRAFRDVGDIRPYYVGPGKINRAEIERLRPNLFLVIKNKNNMRRIFGAKISIVQELAGICGIGLKRQNLVVIDDEADQATQNTAAPGNRTVINRCVTDWLDETKRNFGSVTYLAYTATPYSPLLNDLPDAPKSLFPNDLLVSLEPSPLYWGSNVFFPVDGTRTPFVLTFDDDDDVAAENALWDSLAWFLAAAACLRVRGDISAPISFLYHESAKTENHAEQARIIKAILNQKERVLDRCRTVWGKERLRVTKNILRKFAPDYCANFRAFGSLPEELPPFEEIERELQELLFTKRIDGDLVTGNGISFSDSDGIRLCIDNSKQPKNGRLCFPSDGDLRTLKKAPVFIAVGGNTLSRGLTIQGLIVTYFRRYPGALDSQQQMGRWFGYPRSRSQVVRVWATEKTNNGFYEVSLADASLERQICCNVSIPAVLRYDFDRRPLTAQNKSKNAEQVRISRVTECNYYRSDSYAETVGTIRKVMAALPGRSTPGALGGMLVFDAKWERDVVELIDCLTEADKVRWGARKEMLNLFHAQGQLSSDWKVVVYGRRRSGDIPITLLPDSGLFMSSRSVTWESDGVIHISSLSDGPVNSALASLYPTSGILIVYELNARDERSGVSCKLICGSLILPKSCEVRAVQNKGV